MSINTKLEFDGGVPNNARLQQVLDQLAAAIGSLAGATIGSPLTIAGANNNMVLSGSSTGNPISIVATGTDSSVAIKISPKGPLGYLQLGPDTDGPGGIGTIEQTDLSIGRNGLFCAGLYQDIDIGPCVAAANLFGIVNSIGTHGIDHNIAGVTALEVEATHNGSSSFTVDATKGIHVLWGSPGGRVVTNAYGIHIENPNAEGGIGSSVVNNYGLKIENVDNATTLNYSIYAGAGKYHFDALTASQPVVTDASKNLVSLAGTTTTVTTASLSGKTMTFTNGILTGFA